MVAPDDTGRAAGNLEFEPRATVEPTVTPPYESPGPYPGLDHAHALEDHDGALEHHDHHDHGRTLGQPAPRGARWQPDSGPKPAAPTWQPPLSEEPTRPEPQATVSDSVWQAPAWLRPEEPTAVTQGPGWTPTSYEQPATIPTWGAPATASPAAAPAWTPPGQQVAEAPAWSPEPEPRPRTQTPPIPELGLDDPATGPASIDEDFVDGGFDDEFDDEPAAPVETRARRRKGTTEVAALEPEPAATPAAAPVDEARPRAKPPRSNDDDFDDDDDDFDDDFDDDDDDFDDDSRSSMSADIVGDAASITAAAQPRKLPWVPIAAVAGVLVLISTYLLQDTLFGTGDEQGQGDETGEVATNEPEAPPETPPPQPEPKPVEEPKPEPKPAIPAEELDQLIADATNLVNRQKHKDATEIIDGILEKMPKEPRALSLRSIVQMENQDYDDALATATECVEVNGEQANCWIVIAVVETTKENWPRALEGYNKYLEIAPDGRFAKSAKLEAKRLTSKVEG